MQDVARQHRISALRAQIEAIEARPPLGHDAAVAAAGGAIGAGRPSQVRLVAPAGVLHEVHAEQRRDGGAALGFALGLARQLLSSARPALFYLHLAHEGQDGGVPYAGGLVGFGVAPEAVILGRMANLVELLWAAEEAIACRAVAAVIADIGGQPKGLDFTVSRRLSLRAAATGTSVFMLRYGRERAASAARLRWQVSPAPSPPPPFDARAPGEPRWRVVLEKGRLGEAEMPAGTAEWLMDWTEHGFAPVSAGDSGGDARPAPYGAQPAELGQRLSQAS